MTPKKTARRQNHTGPQPAPQPFQQPLPQPSDYETDTLDIPPVPPGRTNADLNLSVIRRHDPHVTAIISIAPYAVMYLFSATTQQWEKSGIEGTLFVCALSPDPATPGAERFSVMVLNRRGLENFRMELANAEDVEVTSEYVILQVVEGAGDGEEGVPRIYGVWIFAEEGTSTERVREVNAEVIRQCAEMAEKSRMVALEGKGQRGEVGAEEGDTEAEPVAESVAMGRQLSLRQLFGNPQLVKEETLSPPPAPTPPARESGHTPQFANTADTDFFLSTRRHGAEKEQAARQGPTGGQAANGNGIAAKADILGELFRKAKKG